MSVVPKLRAIRSGKFLRPKFGAGRLVVLLGGLLIFGCASQVVHARDAFVLLSGGASPLENNYSQYLQARAMVKFFESRYPPDSIWVFFGAGNVQGDPPIFGDVRRKVKREGTTIDTWLPGTLSRNRPAKSQIFLRALRDEILPTIAKGGTLYLFVGDHGSLERGANGESVINLWSLDRDSDSENGWTENPDETLGVGELRRTLRQGMGKGRIVFVMTQCHAGGFHYLAVPRQMTPNRKWFTDVPGWATPRSQRILERAAGFTATDEESAAAGCDPDPDPDNWAGYERYIPEYLLGMDLFRLESNRRALRSFAEAHVAATLVDATIDKPYSTSEHYLARWASLIETRLAEEPHVTDKVKKQLVTFQATLDGATPKTSDNLFRERQKLFQRFIAQLTEQNPAAKELLLTGSQEDLEEVIRRRNRASPGPRAGAAQSPETQQPSEEQRPRRRGRGQSAEIRRLLNETIRPAWKRAVEADEVSGIDTIVLVFEKHLLRKEADGVDYLFGDFELLEEEIFWQGGYGNPATLNTQNAERIARWAVERRRQILTWAMDSEDAEVQAAAERINELRPIRRVQPSTPAPSPTPAPEDSTVTQPPTERVQPISRKVAAERTLFYRRVLAAWEFLLAMNERSALERVRELTLLEQTPLPKAR